MSNETPGFAGEFEFLNNAYVAPFDVGGVEFPSVDHAYHAYRTTDMELFHKIRTADTPAIARRMGARILKKQLRPGWLAVRDQHMYRLLVTKFRQVPGLAEKLMNTPENIVYYNSLGDDYWGIAFGKGLNNLGTMLMHIRNRFNKGELKAEVH